MGFGWSVLLEACTSLELILTCYQDPLTLTSGLRKLWFCWVGRVWTENQFRCTIFCHVKQPKSSDKILSDAKYFMLYFFTDATANVYRRSVVWLDKWTKILTNPKVRPQRRSWWSSLISWGSWIYTDLQVFLFIYHYGGKY